ncbi:MAG: HAD family hydrolase [Clostridium sp.]|nr:HAD family hydrolase [Clostridium sp.]
MKTLYVSDLDGTLLNSNQTTSQFTNDIINSLAEKGVLFSYATARSYSTARRAAKGISAQIPLVVYNGTFVIDNLTGERLISNFFQSDIKDIIIELLDGGINPIVYSIIDDEEKFSYIKDKCNAGQKLFLESRKGDSRDNPVENETDLLKGDIFYISCIYDDEHLQSFYNKYKNQFNCLYQRDIYDDTQWLEIMPLEATKANGILTLKKLLSCDKIVAFGDGINDVDMFKIADECYAVSNAVDELKAIAAEIIDSNNNDGVAKWLAENVNPLVND